MTKHQASGDEASLLDYLKALPQYLLPHHALSAVMHRLARIETPVIKNAMIRFVIRHYQVDMSLARQSDYRAYPSFNAFFTRELKPQARPLPEDPRVIVSPVDGAISQLGAVREGRIFQAKGRDFGLQDLLGGDAGLARRFEGGRFATLYLSPRDYHRIHCPMDAQLREMIHVPGRLFSVNPATTRVIPGLFARNERVVAVFDTVLGPMALVMVGAIFVSSIETVWAGEVTPPSHGAVQRWDYTPGQWIFRRGDEVGRFNMGSTVIVLFGDPRIQLWPGLQSGAALVMGQPLAQAG